jgi:hypothetical protein
MCGDMDDENRVESDLYARFLLSSRALIAQYERRQARAPAGGTSPSAYMDKLFIDALSRVQRDGEAAEPADRYDRIAMQTLVFARLAGLMAGHLALEEDPLRKALEALMHGYGEAERITPDHGHDHDHDHAHDDHDHDIGHDHHH